MSPISPGRVSVGRDTAAQSGQDGGFTVFVGLIVAIGAGLLVGIWFATR